MFRITAILVSAVSNPREDRTALEHGLGEGFGVEVTLPRQALGVPVFDDKRLAHSAIVAPNSALGLGNFDAPNMPATVAYRLVLFHRISVSALY